MRFNKKFYLIQIAILLLAILITGFTYYGYNRHQVNPNATTADSSLLPEQIILNNSFIDAWQISNTPSTATPDYGPTYTQNGVSSTVITNECNGANLSGPFPYYYRGWPISYDYSFPQQCYVGPNYLPIAIILDIVIYAAGLELILFVISKTINKTLK